MPSLVDHVLGFGLFWIDKLLTTGKAHLLKLECFLVVLLLKVSRHHLIRRVLPLNHFTSREMLVRNPWLLNWGVHQHLILHISGLLCFSWYYERWIVYLTNLLGSLIWRPSVGNSICQSLDLHLGYLSPLVESCLLTLHEVICLLELGVFIDRNRLTLTSGSQAHLMHHGSTRLDSGPALRPVHLSWAQIVLVHVHF